MSRYSKLIIKKIKNTPYLFSIQLSSMEEKQQRQKAGEEENLRKELHLAGKRIAELEEENRKLKEKLLKLDN